MRTRTRRTNLDRLHAYTKAKRRTRRRLHKAGSLRLDPEQEEWEAADLAARYPVGHFGPQHDLTPAQAWVANRLLARANRLRPIQGRHAPQRYAARIGGIISSVLGGRVGNSTFGRSLHGHRGGRVMALHGLHILREIAPVGRQASQAAREGRKALKVWTRAGEILPLGQQDLAAWSQQEQEKRPFLAW